LVGIAVSLYAYFHERRINAPLAIQLPSCRSGVYSPSAKSSASAARAEPQLVDDNGKPIDGQSSSRHVIVDAEGNALTPPPHLDDILGQLEREQCENSKGLDGTAMLNDNELILQVHNPSAYTLKSARVQFVFTLSTGPSFSREYEFQGSIPNWSDGTLSTNTNLKSRGVRAMKAALVSVWFETPK
jgi:hypothetical protein